MHYREPFSLFKRSLPSGRVVYYYVVWDELGRRRQFSTGERLKALAHKVCLELYRKNQLIPVGPRLLEDFARDWFVYDRCPYIQAKLLRGFSYSRTNADHQRGYLDQYVLPKFGKRKMDSIKVAQVEDWLLELKRKGLSNNSVNHILAVFKILFNEADRLGYLLSNPAKAVKNLAENSRPKGFLEDDEVERLFDKATWEATWSGQWMQDAFNLTACQTGMRLGEIRANKAWGVDITYTRTPLGRMFLTVVVDLGSRRVVGWAMPSDNHRQGPMDALFLAVPRRRPWTRVLIRSDPGAQFGSDDGRRLCAALSLEPSRSRRGNCRDNAVVESLVSSFKKERTRDIASKTIRDAKADAFDGIEGFYNRKRRHSTLGHPSPLELETPKQAG